MATLLVMNWDSIPLGSLDASDFNRYPTGVVRDEESWSEPTWRVTLGYKEKSSAFLIWQNLFSGLLSTPEVL